VLICTCVYVYTKSYNEMDDGNKIYTGKKVFHSICELWVLFV